MDIDTRPEEEQALRARLREFVERNLNADDDVVLRDGDDIFKQGWVTSLFAMRLLTFLEKAAGVTVADDDIVLANFSSIDAMAALARRCRSTA